MAAIKGRTLKLRDAADVQKKIEKVMKKTALSSSYVSRKNGIRTVNFKTFIR